MFFTVFKHRISLAMIYHSLLQANKDIYDMAKTQEGSARFSPCENYMNQEAHVHNPLGRNQPEIQNFNGLLTVHPDIIKVLFTNLMHNFFIKTTVFLYMF